MNAFVYLVLQFRYASCLDWLLMLLGTVAAMLHGAAFPVAMNVFGDIANAFVQYDISRGIANTFTVGCPSLGSSILITNFSGIVGGDDYVCDTQHMFVDQITNAECNFTVASVQVVLFGNRADLSPCFDNGSFIDEINFQVYIFIGIAAAALLVATFQVWFYQTAAERQLHRIRLSFYRSMLRQDMAWFDANPAGELASRMSR